MVPAEGKCIAFAEILIGPNQETEAASERLKKVFVAAGYKPGDMEYLAIMVSGLTAWS